MQSRKKPEEGFKWVLKSIDTSVHGEPDEDNFENYVQGYNQVGSFYHAYKNDIEKAKEYFQKSVDVFTRFTHESATETIAGRTLKSMEMFDGDVVCMDFSRIKD